MRTPAEQVDANDTGIAPDAEHEHEVHNYVWGEHEDGAMWQVGKCVICHHDCRREGKTIQEMLRWEVGN